MGSREALEEVLQRLAEEAVGGGREGAVPQAVEERHEEREAHALGESGQEAEPHQSRNEPRMPAAQRGEGANDTEFGQPSLPQP